MEEEEYSNIDEKNKSKKKKFKKQEKTILEVSLMDIR